MPEVVAATSCKDLFRVTVRESFEDLDLHEDVVAEYLTDLLSRFAFTDHLLPATEGGARVETIGDCIGEIQRAWSLEAPGFDPARELEYRRHIGDYTLFMSGFFWEHVRGASVGRHYRRQGKRAYRFLFEHERALRRPEGKVYRKLADGFETWANVLTYLREVYLGAEFAPWPHPLFVRIINGC